MKRRSLEIQTSMPDVRLREFTNRADDRALFELTQHNRDFWRPFAGELIDQNAYISWVTASRKDGNEGGEHQFGIYAEEALVGWTTVTDFQRYPEVGYWLGIWLDESNTHKGFATVAITGMAQHIRSSQPEAPWLSTAIHEENLASRALFERIGFTSNHGTLPNTRDDHISYKLPPEAPILL